MIQKNGSGNSQDQIGRTDSGYFFEKSTQSDGYTLVMVRTVDLSNEEKRVLILYKPTHMDSSGESVGESYDFLVGQDQYTTHPKPLSERATIISSIDDLEHRVGSENFETIQDMLRDIEKLKGE